MEWLGEESEEGLRIQSNKSKSVNETSSAIVCAGANHDSIFEGIEMWCINTRTAELASPSVTAINFLICFSRKVSSGVFFRVRVWRSHMTKLFVAIISLQLPWGLLNNWIMEVQILTFHLSGIIFQHRSETSNFSANSAIVSTWKLRRFHRNFQLFVFVSAEKKENAPSIS